MEYKISPKFAKLETQDKYYINLPVVKKSSIFVHFKLEFIKTLVTHVICEFMNPSSAVKTFLRFLME